MKKVALFTDGACLGNPGPGGWAALLRYGDNEKMVSGAESETTNNRMELAAVINGLTAITEACSVEIFSDSKYVIEAFEKGWLAGWQRNGWKTAAKKPVKNQDLWEELYDAVQRHRVQWTWVKGHNGHIENERVDLEARSCAEKIARHRL